MKRERGQSLIELAISLVILLYLLSGAAEFGILFFQYIQLRDAAQEGALYGSLNPPTGVGDANDLQLIEDIKDRAKNAADKPLDLANDPLVTVNVAVTGGYCEGGAIKVTVSYPHTIFMPFVPRLIGTSAIQLDAEVTDTILTPVCP